MEKTLLTNAMIAGFCLSAAGAIAQQGNPFATTTIGVCPKGFSQAKVTLEAQVVQNTPDKCPLLQDNQLRKLVEKNMFGTEFVWPSLLSAQAPCLSGTVVEGVSSTVEIDGQTMFVRGTTESAQRFFPEAEAYNPLSIPGTPLDGKGLGLLGLFYNNETTQFFSGAAVTSVSLEDVDPESDWSLQLLLSDRFTVNTVTGADTEEFEVVGADKTSVTGRLTGEAVFLPNSPIEFVVEGDICIK